MSENVKVGIMTLVTVTLLIFMIFKIGDLHFGEKGYDFIVSFYNVNGLNEGAGVRISGVKIGKVTQITLEDELVNVKCHIDDTKRKIRNNCVFTILGEGLMGDKHLEITPSRDFTAPYIENNEKVVGTNLTNLDTLIDQGSSVLQKLQELADAANEIVGDPNLKEDTRTIFRNARNASDNINEVTASVRSRSDHIVENLDRLLNNLTEEVEKNRQDIKEIIENFRKISANIEDVSGGSKEDMKDIIANIKKSTDKLDQMIAKLNENDKLTTDVRETVNSLKEASNNAKEITQEVKEIIVDKDVRKQISTALDDAHKLAQTVDNVFLNIKQTRVDFKYMLRYNKETEDLLSDINVDIYPSDTYFFRIGVENIGNGDDLNLMLSRDANTKFIKRVGIMKSKVGIGADYLFGKNLGLSLEIIDTKDTEIRVKASYLINEHVTFELRIDDAADKEQFNFGLEYLF